MLDPVPDSGTLCGSELLSAGIRGSHQHRVLDNSVMQAGPVDQTLRKHVTRLPRLPHCVTSTNHSGKCRSRVLLRVTARDWSAGSSARGFVRAEVACDGAGGL